MQTGSVVGFKIFHSSNGGDSWQESQLNTSAALQDFFPSHTTAGGGDIVFTYDKEGTLYCSWIYLLANPSEPNYLSNLLWCSFWAKSIDNGQTFTFEDGDNKFFGKGVIDYSSGQIQIVDTETGVCDRQWLAVDMTDGSYSNRTYISFLQGSLSYGFGLVVKTLNNQGTAFENPVMAYEGAIQHANILVDKNGILHCSFINAEQNTVLYINSNDGAQTFSAPYLIYQGTSLTPNSSNIIINDRESGAPSLAIDGDDNLHLVWSDIDSTVKSVYSKSTDNGQNWTESKPLTDYFNDMVFMPVVSAKENVFIEIQSENNEQFSFEILNLKGQKIFYDSYDIAEGQNRISIDLTGIA